jgi:hypothetical protein
MACYQELYNEDVWDGEEVITVFFYWNTCNGERIKQSKNLIFTECFQGRTIYRTIEK